MYSRHTRKRLAHALLRTVPVLLLMLTCAGYAAGPQLEFFITMGDYRYEPDVIEVHSGQTVVLQVTNTDRITPHNFTLVDQDAGLDVDTDIGAGDTALISITPQRPGSYTWHCNKKLPFMKSHRDRGMQGTLVVH